MAPATHFSKKWFLGGSLQNKLNTVRFKAVTKIRLQSDAGFEFDSLTKLTILIYCVSKEKSVEMFLKVSLGVLVVVLAIHWRQTFAEEDQDVLLSRQKRQCEIFCQPFLSVKKSCSRWDYELEGTLRHNFKCRTLNPIKTISINWHIRP